MLSSRIGQQPEWDLTIAAPWIDRLPRRQAGADAANFFLQTLSASTYGKLRYIRLRSMGDPLVQAFLTSLDIPAIDAPYEVNAVGMEDYHLDEIVVLLARDPQGNHLLHKLSA